MTEKFLETFESYGKYFHEMFRTLFMKTFCMTYIEFLVTNRIRNITGLSMRNNKRKGKFLSFGGFCWNIFKQQISAQ